MAKTVAVIGGGYGGAAVAKALDQHADVVLIEPKDAFVHAAGSLRALVRPEWADNMFFPYGRLLDRGKVVHERAVSVDPGRGGGRIQRGGVTLASGARVEADYLVLASGSGYPYPAKTETDVAEEALARIRDTHAELAAARRVLLLGAGPVGLELSGEITSVWPGKQVVVVDPATRLMPAFAPELRADLHRQLDERGVDLRLGTALTESPLTDPGQLKPFTVRTTAGAEISADIWFRCYGVDVNGGYLDDGLVTTRTGQGQVKVTERLNVEGHEHIYAIGDITDLAEAKMAGYAMRHAAVVAENIIAQLRGDQPAAVYRPSAIPSMLLPLGPAGGVGQVPSPEGPVMLAAKEVAEYKGVDLFIGRFTELFGIS